MKARRHFAIVETVSNQRIETQEELCEELRKKGFDVTQATISRDIKELKLVKIPDRQGYRYALPEKSGHRYSYDRMKRLFADAVVSVEHNEYMIVIKTLPGTAHAVASTIDNSELEGILGTVAGDDTILVVLKAWKYLPEVFNQFSELIAVK
ncbi:MAG: arginine repressor [Syntrophomonadaceae bacterium]|nr:arginine repressor [Syntrophomonadaceae bacterium]